MLRPVNSVQGTLADELSPAARPALDKFALYQDAVQAPAGDISYMLRFFHAYVGNQV